MVPLSDAGELCRLLESNIPKQLTGMWAMCWGPSDPKSRILQFYSQTTNFLYSESDREESFQLLDERERERERERSFARICEQGLKILIVMPEKLARILQIHSSV